MTTRDRWRWRFWRWSQQPIIIGPWRSEIGFESLYWLSWLARWRELTQIPKERLIVVSRGGTGVWYDVGRTVELYDYAPVEAVRKAMLADAQQVGSIKQQVVTPWEVKLVALMAQDLGIQRYHWLHPKEMYQRLSSWWGGRMGAGALFDCLRFPPIPVPVPPLNLALPERYVAVRFYARHTWPMTDELKAWVMTLVDGMAKYLPVVVLETGLHTDDHMDFPISGPNVISLASHVTLQDNLAMQSAVIAKADAFVGTYGGVQQLAVRLKKPSVGFYKQFSGTAYAHKALTEQLAVSQGTPCWIGRPEEAKMMADVMRGF